MRLPTPRRLLPPPFALALIPGNPDLTPLLLPFLCDFLCKVLMIDFLPASPASGRSLMEAWHVSLDFFPPLGLFKSP